MIGDATWQEAKERKQSKAQRARALRSGAKSVSAA